MAHCQWHTAWEQGDRSFVQAPAIGPTPKLTVEQKALIRQHIIAGPKAAGYEQQIWTQKRIADLIVKLTGIPYHPSGIRVLMASMDISYQKPALRTRQKSDAKKADFLEYTWVAAKRGQ
jgi:transposase